MSSINVIEAASGKARIYSLALASLVRICPNATMSPNRRFLTALSLNGVLNPMRQFKRSALIAATFASRIRFRTSLNIKLTLSTDIHTRRDTRPRNRKEEF